MAGLEGSKSQPVTHEELTTAFHASDKDVPNKETTESESNLNVKLDKHGFPLVPQPSDNKDDPLVSSGDRSS